MTQTQQNSPQAQPPEVAFSEAEHTLAMFRRARQQFGLDRIQMGALLAVIRENGLWKGRASTWDEFLAAEHINPNAARQYMNVARRLVFEMELDESTLANLANVGMTALNKAVRVITQENKDRVFAMLTSLGEKDAIQAIIDMGRETPVSAGRINLRVIKLMREFQDLPPDLQNEFLQSIRKKTPAASSTPANPAQGVVDGAHKG